LPWRRGREAPATVLALAVAVPALLAFGTKLPLYEHVYEALSPFRYSGVPERLMPIAVLALAGLTAVATEKIRRPALVAAVRGRRRARPPRPSLRAVAAAAVWTRLRGRPASDAEVSSFAKEVALLPGLSPCDDRRIFGHS